MSKNLAVSLAALVVLTTVSILKMDEYSIYHISGYLLGAVLFVFVPSGVCYLLRKSLYFYAVIYLTVILVLIVFSSN